MQIDRFIGKNINGYQDFDVSFNTSLTFITGINGTGKTTVLNCIASLLIPRLDFLSLHIYDKFSLDIRKERKTTRLWSTKTREGATLRCSDYPHHRFDITAYNIDDAPAGRADLEDEFYRDQIARSQSDRILSFILNLPTPMYLGLDRRSLSLEEPSARYTRMPMHRRPRRRNVFSQSLGQSLTEASFFARESYRQAQNKKDTLDEEFRKEIVLDLIEFEPISFSPKTLHEPSEEDIAGIRRARRTLQRLPELLNVPDEKIIPKLDPLFKFLEDKYTTIRYEKNKPKSSQRRRSPTDEFTARIEWSYNKNHLDKLNSISRKISQYNARVDQAFYDIHTFLRIVNSFFVDSGKHISFSALGELCFSLPNDSQPRDLRTLSSGEIQMIVILTHLHFNPEVKQANVFIIDEPELSLHVEWQEKFVNAMLEVSEKTQFLLATHSPSIILDKVSCCVDLTT